MQPINYYEYQNDGFFSGFADEILLKKEFDTLPDAENYLINKFPEAWPCTYALVGLRYCIIFNPGSQTTDYYNLIAPEKRDKSAKVFVPPMDLICSF